jgi:hypothetical protein
MKKFFVLVWLLVSAMPASAEWVLYQRTPETDELLDPKFVNRTGPTIQLWTLTNYPSPVTNLEGIQLLSEKALTTVDCEARKSGSEKVMKYSRKNGEGDVVGSMETALRLISVRKGSADELLLAKLCQ